MKNDSKGSMRLSADNSNSSRETRPTNPQVLTPAQWARVVLGVTAPFGHDHLPTVFG